MKRMLTLALATLIATSAFATVNPDPDIMGFYFDLEVDLSCVEDIAPYSQLHMYLVITHMNSDAIYGFEVGYEIEGSAMILNTSFANPNVMDVGGPGNHIIGFGSPTPATPVTLLATLLVLYMDTTMGPVYFHMHGTTPSSIDPLYPVILLADGVLQSVGVNSYYNPDITSVINAVCYSATENVSFDSIKSLYR